MKPFWLLLFATILNACGGSLPISPQTLPPEIEQLAVEKMFPDFEMWVVQATMTVQENTKRMLYDPSFISDAAKAAAKTVQYKKLEALSGDLSQNEKNDGYNGAWCLKLESSADSPTSRFAVNGKIIRRYAFVALKKFKAWDVQQTAYWELGESENAMISRCNMSVVKRGQ